MDCIPAGMELFPAADQDQFDFIKRVIDDCDYYLLIIAGRYGSVSKTGLSYTEQEYDYAVSRGLKVIALVHENPDDIVLGKSEKDPASQEKLKQFREKVCTGRLVKLWKKPEELPALVAMSVPVAIKMFPATGWVRADRVASEKMLTEISALQKTTYELSRINDQLRQQLADVKPSPAVERLAGLDEDVAGFGRYWNGYDHSYQGWTVTTTWEKLFGYISPYLEQFPNEEYVKSVLTSALFVEFMRQRSLSRTFVQNEELDDQFFQTVGVQLSAIGLVKRQYSQAIGGGMAMFWSLTGAGRRQMLELRTVRTTKSNAPDLSGTLGAIGETK